MIKQPIFEQPIFESNQQIESNLVPMVIKPPAGESALTTYIRAY